LISSSLPLCRGNEANIQGRRKTEFCPLEKTVQKPAEEKGGDGRSSAVFPTPQLIRGYFMFPSW